MTENQWTIRMLNERGQRWQGHKDRPAVFKKEVELLICVTDWPFKRGGVGPTRVALLCLGKEVMGTPLDSLCGFKGNTYLARVQIE